VLYIVAADEDETAAPVDGCGVDDRQARLAAARRDGRIEGGRAEAADQIGGGPDQREHDHEGDEEAQRERHLGAEKCLEHRFSPRSASWGPFTRPAKYG
jgi:hypothetical protein